MALIPRRPFRRRRDGRFEINLDPDERELVRSLLDQLRDLLLADDPNLRRLFPVAHADDPEAEATYQELVHGQLIESRFAMKGLPKISAGHFFSSTSAKK